MDRNQVLFDMCRLRDDYDSQTLLNSISLNPREVLFSFGYNDGRNRRELLALISRRSKDLEFEESFLSIRSISSNSEENLLTINFLRDRRRKEHTGKFFLDLRGTAMEKHYKRRFNDEDLNILFEFLEERPYICGLHLPYNNLTSHGFAKLSEFLADHRTIKYVNVMNNDITHLDHKKLQEHFSGWNVQCLNLRGNKIGRKGGETIAYLLTKNSSIRHLALGETDQTVNSAMAILDSMIQFEGNKTLTKLDFTNTLAKTYVGDLCRRFVCVLEVNRSLVELVLSKNNITDLDLEILLEGLKYQNVLSRLILSCNHISSIGAELIANILPASDLKLLALDTNIIGDSGAMAIGRVFPLSKLKYLDLSRNLIGDLGMTHLIWGICRPMDGFFIFGNKFTDHTVKVIHSQVMDLMLDPKTLDIRLWFDEEGNIHHTRRNLWRYSEWYYYVPEWEKKSIIQHCCCPIRGGIMVQLKSDD